MTHVALKITLKDAVVLSERESTMGGHRTLRHIPGSVLLGVAASRLYRRLSADDAFLVFHSGRVRFMGGFPSMDGHAPAWPMPLALHRAKLGKGDEVINACFGVPDDGRQRVALREGFLADGQGGPNVRLSPRTMRVTKTAIDASTGSAAESQLFSYECLAPGQVFIAGIEADDDVPSPLVDAVKAALIGEVRLGRSRSAEFGRATIEQVDATTLAASTSPLDEGAAWLLSDLAVLDAWGQPTVQPTAADLGLPGRIDWSRSFVRTRRYAPWNAHRGGYDAERLLLQAGSVLWITDADGRLHGGQYSTGRYTEAGLGRLWLAPPLLMRPEVAVVDEEERTPSEARTHAPAGASTMTPLLTWFRSRATRAGVTITMERQVDRLVSDLVALYARVQDELAPAEGVSVGPSSSQWRDIARIAETTEGDGLDLRASRLRDALFGKENDLTKRPGWRDPYWDASSRRRLRFVEGFKSLWEGIDGDGDRAAILALVARRLSKHEVVGGRDENRRTTTPKEAQR